MTVLCELVAFVVRVRVYVCLQCVVCFCCC